MKKNIGFIGIGNMGQRMCENLSKYISIKVYDKNKKALNSIKYKNIEITENLKNLCVNTNIVITMLRDSKQVKEICRSKRGLFNNLLPGSIIINCSTIDIETSIELYQEGKSRNIYIVDCPVSGGVNSAKVSELTFMVGGEKTIAEKIEPILKKMGTRVIYTGKAGSGQAAKICNNMLLGITMIGACEAFLLAEKLGLSYQKLYEVLTNSSSDCWSVRKYPPVPGIIDNVPANNDYNGGFSAELMLKDLFISQKALKNVNMKGYLSKESTKLYRKFNKTKYKSLDFSAIIKFLSNFN